MKTHERSDHLQKLQKQWESLTIQDSFIFSKVFRTEALCRELVQMILPEIRIERVVFPASEKDLKYSVDGHGIRLDIYTKDQLYRVYDIEMQAANTYELPKRSRYYAGMIDQDELEQGEHYSSLTDSFIIFICPFDLFGAGKYRYTFRGLCVEDSRIALKDGTTRIFLNTTGTRGEATEELKQFLAYVSGKPADNDFLRAVDRAVQRAKKNRKWRANYMNSQLYLLDARERGLREGEALGLRKGEALGLQKGEALGLQKGEALGLQKGEALGLQKGEALGLQKGEALGLRKGEALGLQRGKRELLSQLVSRGLISEKVAAEYAEPGMGDPSEF